MLPIDSSVQAEYSDGFVLDETEHRDVSPYNPKYNIFRAILNKEPEKEHGNMMRFSVFWKDQRYDVDWHDLPDNARPIRFRHGYHRWNAAGSEDSGWLGVDFGYQYLANGKSVKEIKELK
jgi:hypothetical protein